ncbi:hypothetical protein BM536_001925 [Streptomyces phaeoluteigriseus]|uniref:Uncharacterized protein n=1 Tax=Streptomyces phaeoluteigriseus TaxID=114686 RepID=A0A1V6MYU4_9ACTN|nr:hypothetical protein BM536_001925 [Streptomyces phaeoluteigriseus]
MLSRVRLHRTLARSSFVRELSHYLSEHPGEQMALMPVYDAARDHAQHGTRTHSRRCPLVTAGAVVVDERDRVLPLRHESAFVLAEAEPEEQDDSLGGAALRLLAETVGIREVWTEPDAEGPVLIDVTRPGQHRYGPRLRIGFRYGMRVGRSAVRAARHRGVRPYFDGACGRPMPSLNVMLSRSDAPGGPLMTGPSQGGSAGGVASRRRSGRVPPRSRPAHRPGRLECMAWLPQKQSEVAASP